MTNSSQTPSAFRKILYLLAAAIILGLLERICNDTGVLVGTAKALSALSDLFIFAAIFVAISKIID